MCVTAFSRLRGALGPSKTFALPPHAHMLGLNYVTLAGRELSIEQVGLEVTRSAPSSAGTKDVHNHAWDFPAPFFFSVCFLVSDSHGTQPDFQCDV